MATGLAPHLEHMMLSGESVIDGPELIWQQDFRETGAAATSNGYSHRKWATFPQFDNVSVDIYRKILDGTVRIPTRKEVIDRTKFVIVNDMTSGSADDMYASPTTLFEGVYRMDGDGNLRDNRSFFKKTGRYPSIPTVFALADDAAKSFKVQIKKSAYAGRWPSITAKVAELDAEFPQEYTGTLFAGRHENGWVIYNPFKDGKAATANIPFKYNTCGSMDITFQLYSAGVVKETADKVSFYLNNYDNVLNTGLKTDEIRINGCASQPTYTFKDRASHAASNVTSSYADGTLTLTIRHNGALDLSVNCSGTATGRLTKFTEAVLVKPELPPVYIGPRQYEAENWEYKSINRITANGTGGSIRNYQGLGYMNFGTNAGAAVRATVNARYSGTFMLQTRYAVTGSDVSTVDLYVNESKIASPLFTKTPTLADWGSKTQEVTLKAGVNTIEFKANAAAASALYFDNIILTGDSSMVTGSRNPEKDIHASCKSAPAVTVRVHRNALIVKAGGAQGELLHVALYTTDGKKVFQNYVQANREIHFEKGKTLGTGVYYMVVTTKNRKRVISPVFKL
jgi:hypothetical protein